MIRTYSIDDSKVWDEVVESYPNHDVYYKSGYLKGFELNGDGRSILVEWVGENGVSAICALMLRDISEDSRFAGKLEAGRWYDATTPYGYGGFIFNQELNDEQLSKVSEQLKKDLKEWGHENNIVSIVMRLHPVLKNTREAETFMDVLHLGKTITMDLSSSEVINTNIISKNRNMIRKAEKNGVVIKHGKGMELLDIFKDIYEETMLRDNATEYYFFDRKFYESIDRDLADNYEIFYAEYEGEIVSMAIMIFPGSCMNYHLSGSRTAYRNLAAGNLLLKEAAEWGCRQGYSTFHLGGGVGAGEDSLYKFKAAFKRNSDTEFALGRLVLDQAKYNELVKIREANGEFNSESKFFPIYRS